MKSLVSFGSEAPSSEKPSKHPLSSTFATFTAHVASPPVSTPLASSSYPQLGCFIISGPRRIRNPKLKSATWPYDNHWYKDQLPGEPLISDSSDANHAYVKRLFSDVLHPTPWTSEFTPLVPLLENLSPVLAVTPQFRTTVTQVEIKVHKVKVIAIHNNGYLVKVISSRFARKFKMSHNLNN